MHAEPHEPSDAGPAEPPPLAKAALPYAMPDTRPPAPKRQPDSIKWTFLGFAVTVIAVLTGAYVGDQYLPRKAFLVGPALVTLLLAGAATVMRWRLGWRAFPVGIAAALALIVGGALTAAMLELLRRHL